MTFDPSPKNCEARVNSRVAYLLTCLELGLEILYPVLLLCQLIAVRLANDLELFVHLACLDELIAALF